MRQIDAMNELESRPSGGWQLPLALFLAALFVNCYGIQWGLPNGNDTWAADSIRPGAPLAILYRTFFTDAWNSGWFWFKYPLGHIYVLGGVYAPYIGWLALTGGLSAPTSVYPHGFADPEGAMMMLALLGRLISAAMGAGAVSLVYLILVRGFGRLAAASAALATGLCYPMVYYAHTTNVEVPYVFWMLLSLLAAVRLTEGSKGRRWWIVLAFGAAMSLATKEIVAGVYVGLAPALAVALWRSGLPIKSILQRGVLAAAVFALTLAASSNAFLNPQGFANRLGFLTQTLDPDIALQYAPYYFPIDLGATRGLDVEFAQLALTAQRVLESVGLPVVLLAAVGFGLAVRQAPAVALLFAASAIGFYLFGVRAMLSLSLRYVLPLAVFASMLAGITLGYLSRAGHRAAVRRPVAVAFVMFIMLYGWDVNRMLTGDGRYLAENWIASNVTVDETIEVYQRPTYLPRFPEWATVQRVDFEQRNIDNFRLRRPDYVVVSSAGLSGVTVEYKEDWSSDEVTPEAYEPSQISISGEVMNYQRRDNVEFLDRLTSGSLGYTEAASFGVDPWIDRPLIQSLNPEIKIYRKDTAQTFWHGSPQHNRADPDSGAAATAPLTR
jgi:hypothetical protein